MSAVHCFEESARQYADEFNAPEDLMARARERLAWRLERSSDRTCAVCGAPIPATKRADAEVCSEACRQRRKRARRAAGN